MTRRPSLVAAAAGLSGLSAPHSGSTGGSSLAPPGPGSGQRRPSALSSAAAGIGIGSAGPGHARIGSGGSAMPSIAHASSSTSASSSAMPAHAPLLSQQHSGGAHASISHSLSPSPASTGMPALGGSSGKRGSAVGAFPGLAHSAGQNGTGPGPGPGVGMGHSPFGSPPSTAGGTASSGGAAAALKRATMNASAMNAFAGGKSGLGISSGLASSLAGASRKSSIAVVGFGGTKKEEKKSFLGAGNYLLFSVSFLFASWFVAFKFSAPSLAKGLPSTVSGMSATDREIDSLLANDPTGDDGWGAFDKQVISYLNSLSMLWLLLGARA